MDQCTEVLSWDALTSSYDRQGGYAYCLAIVKSEDIDIIGREFRHYEFICRYISIVYPA